MLIFIYAAIPGGKVTNVVLVSKLFPKSLAQNFARQVIHYLLDVGSFSKVVCNALLTA
jgi:hypothetical protein